MKHVGEVKGEEQFSYAVAKGVLKWELEDPRIAFREGSGVFMAKANVRIEAELPLVGQKVFSYSPDVKGHVEVKYNSMSDSVELAIRKATFDLYLQLTPQRRLTLKQIDVASWINTKPFVFEGVKSFILSSYATKYGSRADVLELNVGGKARSLTVDVVDCEVHIVSEAVKLSCKINIGPN